MMKWPQFVFIGKAYFRSSSGMKFNNDIDTISVCRKSTSRNRSGMTFNEKFPTVMFQVKGSVHKITGMKFNDQVSLICVHGQIMSWT